ncbi:hypothetical protein AAFG13_37340 [Bradyrhizobium sp. B124]|uniref:hypothetical protein n=1 Tax=Bradyrhizobium sp. B124 TaxID=3140245 RepID=UPI0031832A5E
MDDDVGDVARKLREIGVDWPWLPFYTLEVAAVIKILPIWRILFSGDLAISGLTGTCGLRSTADANDR